MCVCVCEWLDNSLCGFLRICSQKNWRIWENRGEKKNPSYNKSETKAWVSLLSRETLEIQSVSRVNALVFWNPEQSLVELEREIEFKANTEK